MFPIWFCLYYNDTLYIFKILIFPFLKTTLFLTRLHFQSRIWKPRTNSFKWITGIYIYRNQSDRCGFSIQIQGCHLYLASEMANKAYTFRRRSMQLNRRRIRSLLLLYFKCSIMQVYRGRERESVATRKFYTQLQTYTATLLYPYIFENQISLFV